MIHTYTPAEQMRLVAQAFPQAAHRVYCMANRKQRDITALALHRGITLGVDEYGDKAFHMSVEQLKHEQLEELADAYFYSAVYTLKATGVIP